MNSMDENHSAPVTDKTDSSIAAEPVQAEVAVPSPRQLGSPVPYATPAVPWAVPEVHHRIALLRDNAVRHGAQGRSLTIVGAVLTLLSVLANMAMTLFIFPFSWSTGSGMMDLIDPVMLCIALLLFAVLGGVGFYAIFVLANINKLYQRTYTETWRKLCETSLPLLISQEPFWMRIQDGLNHATVFKFIGRSTYRRIEDHLAFCACHLESLEACGRNERVSIWQLRRENAPFRNQKLFQQSSSTYWIGGCFLFLFGRILFILALLFTILGSRYVSSRASLVAICEFLLVDDTLPGKDAGLPDAAGKPGGKAYFESLRGRSEIRT